MVFSSEEGEKTGGIEVMFLRRALALPPFCRHAWESGDLSN